MGDHFQNTNRYPNVPDSLNHHATDFYDMSSIDESEKKAPSPPPPVAPPQITPYLALRSRLSQIWFNRWTILILLVLVNFIFSIGDLNENLKDAKTQALAACTKVEDVGSAFASMPHYLSSGVNELTASTVTHAVGALMSILDMILTGIQELILFVIGMYTNTYVCLITMVVHGGLNASAEAVEKTTDAINDLIQDVAKGLESKAGDIQGAINSIVGIANTVEGGVSDATQAAASDAGKATSAIGNAGVTGMMLLPRSIDAPDVTGPITSAMNNLEHVSINSSGFVQGIDQINNQIPTFQQVQNLTSEVISYPFNLIKEELAKVYGNWTFNASLFPVAEKQSLSFCSDNDGLDKFFEELFTIAYRAKIAAIVILAILAVLACPLMAYLEVRRWRRQNTYARIFSRSSFDGLDIGYMYGRPLTSRAGLAVSTKLAGPERPLREIMIRWTIAYATSLPALFVLSLALAGFFSCLWQAVLLRLIQREVPALEQEVGGFAGQVVGSLENVSQRWANDSNAVIGRFSDEINGDVLGHVTNATTAVNNTLTTLMSEIDKGITDVFGNTLFADLAQEVVFCLVGLKVESVQKGLTWVTDHAHVNFPTFPADIFSAGAAASIGGDSNLTSFLAQPGTVSTDEVSGAVLHVVAWLRNSIVRQGLTSLALLLVYVVAVLSGVLRAVSSRAAHVHVVEDDGERRRSERWLTPRARSAVPDGSGRAF
ncbi:hypothetical protein GGR56DRAFT_662362 [Xylariaceae sp. FL0804]|nr:hypothetical protein GGR56DRAFT_662362 [Xylariaceae sp. FL0804]